MTLAIGYEPNCGVIVIQGNGVFPARSLTASLSATLPNTIAIKDLGGRGEQTVLWGDLTSLDGSFSPASMADALAYLNAEFAKGPSSRAMPAPYPLNGAASFAISHGLSYVPSATVIDPDGAEVDTDITHAPGLTTLNFASPFTGTLYLG